jgi:hypothetical protein
MRLQPARQTDAVATELLEIIIPHANYAAIAAAESLFAALALSPGGGLFAGDRGQKRGALVCRARRDRTCSRPS